MKYSIHMWAVLCALVAGPCVVTAQDSLLPLPNTPPLSAYQQPYRPQAQVYPQNQPPMTPFRTASATNFGTYDQAYDWAQTHAVQASNTTTTQGQNVFYNGATWDQAMTGNYSSCGTGCDNCATACGTGCGVCCGPLWTVSARALIMTRTSTDPFHFSYESTTPSVCRMRSDDPRLEWWQGGIDVSIQRRLGCYGGLQLNYWTIAPTDNEISLIIPGGVLNTSINLDPVPGVPPITFAGQPLSDYFDGAGEQRLRRNNEFHSAEMNYIHNFRYSGPSSPLGGGVLVGFRYFRFDEGLRFGSVQNGFQFGSNGGIHEAYYDVDTLNNLYGLQGGGFLERFFWGRFRIYGNAKAGIFFNDAEQRTEIYRGDGLVALDLASNQDAVAFLAQIDVGISGEITKWLRGDIGYRALGVSTVALADQQIPAFVHDTAEMLDVNTAGSIVLHGGYAGLSVVW